MAGGSGAFFSAADRIISLDHYVAHDVTNEARKIAPEPWEAGRNSSSLVFSYDWASRVPTPSSLVREVNQKPAKSRGTTILFAGETIDLSAVTQLVDPAQNQAIARALDRITALADGRMSIRDLILTVEGRIDTDGLDWLSPFNGHPGHLARPRHYELHAALNRLRGLCLTGT